MKMVYRSINGIIKNILLSFFVFKILKNKENRWGKKIVNRTGLSLVDLVSNIYKTKTKMKETGNLQTILQSPENNKKSQAWPIMPENNYPCASLLYKI